MVYHRPVGTERQRKSARMYVWRRITSAHRRLGMLIRKRPYVVHDECRRAGEGKRKYGVCQHLKAETTPQKEYEIEDVFKMLEELVPTYEHHYPDRDISSELIAHLWKMRTREDER